jgi:hypothetical protein
VNLIRKLCDIEALNVLDQRSHPRLDQILRPRLGLPPA